MTYEAWLIDNRSMSFYLLLLLALHCTILPVKAPPRNDKGKAPAEEASNPPPPIGAGETANSFIQDIEAAAIRTTLESVPELIARLAIRNYRHQFLHDGLPAQPAEQAVEMEAVKFGCNAAGQLLPGWIAQAAIRAYRFYLQYGLPQTWLPQAYPRLQQAWLQQEQQQGAAAASFPIPLAHGMSGISPQFSPISPNTVAGAFPSTARQGQSAAARQVQLAPAALQQQQQPQSPTVQQQAGAASPFPLHLDMDDMSKRTSQLQRALHQQRVETVKSALQLQRSLFHRQFSSGINWRDVPAVQLHAGAVPGHGVPKPIVIELPKFGGEGSQKHQQYKSNSKEEQHGIGQSAAAGGNAGISGRGEGGLPKKGLDKGVLKRRQSFKRTRKALLALSATPSTGPPGFVPDFNTATSADDQFHQHHHQQEPHHDPSSSIATTADLLSQSSLMREHYQQGEQRHRQEHGQEQGQQQQDFKNQPELRRFMPEIGAVSGTVWQPVAIHAPGPELSLVSPHQTNVGGMEGGRGEVGAVHKHEPPEQQGQGKQQHVGPSGFRRYRPQQQIRVPGPELLPMNIRGGEADQPEEHQPGHQQQYIVVDDIGRGEREEGAVTSSSSSFSPPEDINLSLMMSPQGAASGSSKMKKQTQQKNNTTEKEKRKRQG